jgi:hypothetical protein
MERDNNRERKKELANCLATAKSQRELDWVWKVV